MLVAVALQQIKVADFIIHNKDCSKPNANCRDLITIFRNICHNIGITVNVGIIILLANPFGML